MAADLVEVELHRLGIDMRQGERCARAARRADGAEQIGALVTLVGGLAGPRAAARPLPDLPVLLAYARFVLEPNLDRRAFRKIGEMGAQRAREVFL
jgi:hypothetical protein